LKKTACTADRGDAHGVLVGLPDRKKHLEDITLDGRIILKKLLQEVE